MLVLFETAAGYAIFKVCIYLFLSFCSMSTLFYSVLALAIKLLHTSTCPFALGNKKNMGMQKVIFFKYQTYKNTTMKTCALTKIRIHAKLVSI